MRGNQKRNLNKTMTIRGVAALAEWSDSRQDADVVILTDSDEEYYIDATDAPIRPAKYINARVEASGKVFERDDQLVLAVNRMRVIESIQDFDPYSDDELDEDAFDDEAEISAWNEDDDFVSYARLIKGYGGV
jgi:hypothetical protein